MNSREIAKFLSGAEAFHAFAHVFLWLSGTTLTVFGIVHSPSGNVIGALINAAISLGLGVYGWSQPRNRSEVHTHNE